MSEAKQKDQKSSDAEIAKEEMAELKKKAAERDEYYNKWLLALAECENMRKRTEKEKINFAKFANEDIVLELFPIMDNFDRAISIMDKAEDKMAVIDGIKMVQKEFHRILEGNGVTRIKTEGEKFDPHLHEAAEMIETDKHPDGSIIEEMRPGYTLNSRLIRPAQVKVAKNVGKKEEKKGNNIQKEKTNDKQHPPKAVPPAAESTNNELKGGK